MEVVHCRYLPGAGIDWSSLAPHAAAGRALLRGFDQQVEETLEPFTGIATGPLRSMAKKVIRAVHVIHGERFGTEIDSIAAAIRSSVVDTVTIQLGYDLSNAAGCSTMAVPHGAGMMLARNLDWAFPGTLLREHGIVVRVEGAPAGDYAMVGWPGFLGGLTAIAPGRFCLAVNYVRLRESRWRRWQRIGRQAVSPDLPVPWATRAILDGAATFTQAVQQLREVPLMSPVIFTLAGTEPGEAVVIERTGDDQAVREAGVGAICTTNHYLSAKLEERNVDLRELDSQERLECLKHALSQGLPTSPREALRMLSSSVLLDSETQQQIAMDAREGFLVARAPGRPTVEVRL